MLHAFLNLTISRKLSVKMQNFYQNSNEIQSKNTKNYLFDKLNNWYSDLSAIEF